MEWTLPKNTLVPRYGNCLPTQSSGIPCGKQRRIKCKSWITSKNEASSDRPIAAEKPTHRYLSARPGSVPVCRLVRGKADSGIV